MHASAFQPGTPHPGDSREQNESAFFGESSSPPCSIRREWRTFHLPGKPGTLVLAAGILSPLVPSWPDGNRLACVGTAVPAQSATAPSLEDVLQPGAQSLAP